MDKVTEVTTAVLAGVVVVGAIALTAQGKPVPPELWAAVGLVLGFFFGNQTGTARGLMRGR